MSALGAGLFLSGCEVVPAHVETDVRAQLETATAIHVVPLEPDSFRVPKPIQREFARGMEAMGGNCLLLPIIAFAGIGAVISGFVEDDLEPGFNRDLPPLAPMSAVAVLFADGLKRELSLQNLRVEPAPVEWPDVADLQQRWNDGFALTIAPAYGAHGISCELVPDMKLSGVYNLGLVTRSELIRLADGKVVWSHVVKAPWLASGSMARPNGAAAGPATLAELKADGAAKLRAEIECAARDCAEQSVKSFVER